MRRRRWIAAAILCLVLSPVAAAAASVAHTESLRTSFDRQFRAESRYPASQLLGAWEGFGRFIDASGAHCDFGAQAVSWGHAPWLDWRCR